MSEAATGGAARDRTPISRGLVAAMVLFFSLMTAPVVSRSFDPAAFNHDVGWVLYVAEQMLDGDRIYIDIVEENPPLIFWISQPSVLLGQAFGTHLEV